MTEASAQLHIHNRLEELGVLSAWVAEQSATLGISPKIAFAIDLCLTEAVNNIISYGYDDAGPRQIDIRMDYRADGASVEVTDDARAFNPLAEPEHIQPASLDTAQIGGLGVHLIKNYANDIRYERRDGRNHLSMVFPNSAPTAATSAPLPDQLHSTLLFAGVPAESYGETLSRCTLRELDTGEILLEAGKPNHELFILLSGGVRIRLDLDDHSAGIRMDAGECVGEMSIIDNEPVSAYVVADESSRVLAIPQEVFWSELAAIPGVARNLGTLLARRMRRQNEMARKAIERELRLEHLEKELNHAREIQLSLLPQHRPLVPGHPQLQIAALMEPAREVGGDLYDVVPLDDQRVVVMVGDVSGKGMPAALFMVKSITLLRSAFRSDVPIDVAVTMVNRQLSLENDACMFVTVTAAVIDVTTGQMGYIHGGHNEPYLGNQRAGFANPPMPAGMLIGVNEDAEYRANQVHLAKDDTLVMYSDGITEANNSKGEMYGDARLRAVITANAHLPAEELLARIRGDVAEFVGDAEQFDDITLLVMRYLG